MTAQFVERYNGAEIYRDQTGFWDKHNHTMEHEYPTLAECREGVDGYWDWMNEPA